MEAEDKSILYQKYNYDNVFNRSVIAGLLYLLNHRLTYEQVWDDNVIETVTIPFAYNFAHAKDQRFAQDNYTFFGRECFSDKFVDGKFDMCPRFALTYTGSQIEASSITNRFVKGKYMKEENGKLVSYTAFMYSIPLNMSFDLEGWIDTLETAFKIEQAVRDTFYKNQTFNVLYRGMKVGCRVGFPESYTVGEKTVSYSFEQDSQLIKMNFSLTVEAYQPCFDESLSLPSDTTIAGFGVDHTINVPDPIGGGNGGSVVVGGDQIPLPNGDEGTGFGLDPAVFNRTINPKTRKVSVKFKDFDKDKPYVAGETVTLSWDSSSNASDVYSVILYYITDDGDKHIIDCIIRQHGFYDWTIPQLISKSNGPNVYCIDGLVGIDRQPSVVAVPNSNGTIDGSSFRIIDGGKFDSDGYVQVSCEYVDTKGKMHISDCYVGVVSGNKLVSVSYYKDIPDLPEIEMVSTKKMKYTKSVGSKITIGIAYPLDMSIKDEISNILIL